MQFWILHWLSWSFSILKTVTSLKSYLFYTKKGRATIFTEGKARPLSFSSIIPKQLNYIQVGGNLMPSLVKFKPTWVDFLNGTPCMFFHTQIHNSILFQKNWWFSISIFQFFVQSTEVIKFLESIPYWLTFLQLSSFQCMHHLFYIFVKINKYFYNIKEIYINNTVLKIVFICTSHSALL